MKLCLYFLLFLTLSAHSQTPPTSISIGTVDSLYSHILGEKRKILVYVPKELPEGIYLPQRYPVVYLLDGEEHFHSVIGVIQKLSENGNTVLPKMIVVGISNTDRTRDFTPTHSDYVPFGDSNPDILKTSGGGEKFTEFLKKELIPQVDSLYPTAPYRIFIGHSVGGLLVINTLIHFTDLFNAYVAIDPSLWWDRQKLITQAAPVLSQKSFQNKTFYLAIANTLNRGVELAQAKKDTSRSTLSIRSIFKLADLLDTSSESGLTYHYKYYKDDDHSSVPLISTYDALRYIFNSYRFPLNFNTFYNKEYDFSSALTAHFNTVSQQLNYQILPPEPYVNSIGYLFVRLKHLNKAEALFQLNVENYPTSANAYDSLGDFYLTKGEKEKARQNFTKSLSLKELPGTREKLGKLLEAK